MADKHKYKKYPFCPRQHLTKINKLSTHCTNLLSSTMYAISLSAYKHNHYINTLLKFPHIKHQTLEIKLYFSPKKNNSNNKSNAITHTHTHIYINYHNLWGISCGDHRHWDLGYELGTAWKKKKKISIYKYKYTIITQRHRIELWKEIKGKREMEDRGRRWSSLFSLFSVEDLRSQWHKRRHFDSSPSTNPSSLHCSIGVKGG